MFSTVRDQCLRQLSIPWNPLVVVRLESRGMSREGGPASAFRLASALEGTGIVVMDAGIGRVCAKVLLLVATVRLAFCPTSTCLRRLVCQGVYATATVSVTAISGRISMVAKRPLPGKVAVDLCGRSCCDSRATETISCVICRRVR